MLKTSSGRRQIRAGAFAREARPRNREALLQGKGHHRQEQGERRSHQVNPFLNKTDI